MSGVSGEKGPFRAVRLGGHTAFVAAGTYLAVSALASKDLSDKGEHYLLVSLGVDSDNWAEFLIGAGLPWVFFIADAATRQCHTAFSGRTTEFTNRAYAEAGGRDLAFWSSLLCLAAVLVLFARSHPLLDWSGWFRPILIFVSAAAAARILARWLASRVFSAAYGRLGAPPGG